MGQIRTSNAYSGTKARTGGDVESFYSTPTWSRRVNKKSSAYLSFLIFPTRRWKTAPGGSTLEKVMEISRA